MNCNQYAYIYPNNYYKFGNSENSYLEDLGKALEDEGYTIIKGGTGWLGPLNFFRYLNKVDVFFVNWLEEVEITRFGLFKVPFVLLFLLVLKFTKIKLVWTIHNKRPHDRNKEYVVSFLRKLLFKQSDLIIAHAKSELHVFGKNHSLITYYPHPFKISNKILKEEKLCPDFFFNDVLIWGRIEPYKGILEFLEYLKGKSLLSKYKIIIQGKCNNKIYWEQLKEYNSKNIKISNMFINEDDLLKLYKETKLVLFTHKDEYLLSSGALIHSLNNYSTILGPDNGNFKDFKKEGIIRTFKNNEELISLLDKTVCDNDFISQYEIYKFIKKHTWDEYAKFLINLLKNLDNKK